MTPAQPCRPRPIHPLPTGPARSAGARAPLARLGVMGALLWLSACQAQPGAASGDLAAEVALLARIRAEIGDARCSSDAQCRTLPIGEKACGGPASWLAWSTSQGRADQLKAWSTELARLQRQREAASGMMSNCQYNADPGARCVAQRCVLVTPRNAN